MELVFLGTSCMKPTKERNHPGMLLLHKGQGILFDCGEGIQRQLQVAGIRPTVIRKILISHWHGDHVLGLPGLLQTLSASGYEGTLEVYGPKGTKKFIDYMGKAFASKDMLDFKVIEVKPGLICDEKEFVLESDDLVHSAPCVGYSFIEKDRRKVKLREVKKLGIPVGPILGKLQNGETVSYKGKKIKPDDVTDVVKGRKIAYVTDTRPCDGALSLAKDADILVMEATYKSGMEEKAKEYFHVTAKEAALVANQANVKQLILTHFSTRYKNPLELEEDARDVFDNTRAAEDFMRVKL